MLMVITKLQTLWSALEQSIEIMKKKPEPTRVRVIDQVKVGDSVQLKYAAEEDIRTTAYYLWEQNGRTGDSDYWWTKAEEHIREKMKAY